MLGRSKRNGKLFNLYPWNTLGVRWCSNCGKRLDVDEWYTRHAIYHPRTRAEAYIALCGTCFPVEQVENASVPVPVEYKDTLMQPIRIIRENTPLPKSGTGWERRNPAHVDEVLTEQLVVHRGIREAFRRVFEQ